MALRLSEFEQKEPIYLENGRKLLKWLDLYKYFSPKRILVSTNERELFVIKLFTNDYIYSIRVTPTYLGCQATTRKPRPGEEWNRGSDLPDGKFGWEVLQKILGAIVFYEAKDIVEPREPTPGVEKEIEFPSTSNVLNLS
ncbi:hypothetical protein LCGC14_1169880 [marine sediment metagenome]|uniref:Uncharacterized protein n=1 Tax=marine sediment metagenome TaxID=412755 RepID=A0A0F9LQA8_9ZZZZ